MASRLLWGKKLAHGKEARTRARRRSEPSADNRQAKSEPRPPHLRLAGSDVGDSSSSGIRSARRRVGFLTHLRSTRPLLRVGPRPVFGLASSLRHVNELVSTKRCPRVPTSQHPLSSPRQYEPLPSGHPMQRHDGPCAPWHPQTGSAKVVRAARARHWLCSQIVASPIDDCNSSPCFLFSNMSP